MLVRVSTFSLARGRGLGVYIVLVVVFAGPFGDLPLDARGAVPALLDTSTSSGVAKAAALNEAVKPWNMREVAPDQLQASACCWCHGCYIHDILLVVILVVEETQFLQIVQVLRQKAAQRQLDVVRLGSGLFSEVRDRSAAESAKVSLGVFLGRMGIDTPDSRS